jgi:hypothetical protein
MEIYSAVQRDVPEFDCVGLGGSTWLDWRGNCGEPGTGTRSWLQERESQHIIGSESEAEPCRVAERMLNIQDLRQSQIWQAKAISGWSI